MPDEPDPIDVPMPSEPAEPVENEPPDRGPVSLEPDPEILEGIPFSASRGGNSTIVTFETEDE